MMEMVAGLLVGFLVGLTGMGGGALMTPLLLILFGKAPATVVGTDLLFALITKLVGIGIHGCQRTIEWGIVRSLCIGAIPASLLTSFWLWQTSSSPAKSGFMVTCIGIMLFVTSLTILFKEKIFNSRNQLYLSEKTREILTIIGGAVIGCIVTITSIGAGVLGSVLIFFLYRLPPKKLVGTDLAYAIPLAFVAGLGHLMFIDFVLLKNLLLGSIPGVIAGSFLSIYLRSKWLQAIIGAVLALISGKLLIF